MMTSVIAWLIPIWSARDIANACGTNFRITQDILQRTQAQGAIEAQTPTPGGLFSMIETDQFQLARDDILGENGVEGQSNFMRRGRGLGQVIGNVWYFLGTNCRGHQINSTQRRCPYGSRRDEPVPQTVVQAHQCAESSGATTRRSHRIDGVTMNMISKRHSITPFAASTRVDMGFKFDP